MTFKGDKIGLIRDGFYFFLLHFKSINKVGGWNNKSKKGQE
jgi:hypothetical protein